MFRMAFASILMYYGDLMHAKHLGADQHFFGSGIFLMVFRMLDGSPTDNLEYVFGQIKQYYKTHEYAKRKRAMYRHLQLSMVCNPRSPESAFPKLKGKAAQVKNIAPALLEVWQEPSDPDDMVPCTHT